MAGPDRTQKKRLGWQQMIALQASVYKGLAGGCEIDDFGRILLAKIRGVW
jgi:hypothetical protein